MKTKALIVFVSYFIIGLSFGQTNDEKKNELSWRLMLEAESAYSFKNEDFQKSEVIIDPEISWKLNKNFKLYTLLRSYNEFNDHLEPGESYTSNYSDLSKPLVLNDNAQVELRELYLDAKLGKMYWRLGKQQIVWGQTEGIKVLDVINPMSWREFILDDFDDSRIPLWSVKSDIAFGDVKLQVFWIPDQSYHHLPTIGGTFEQNMNMPQLPPGVQLQINETYKPDDFFEDGDVGARISTFVKGWDLSLSYLYHYDDVPLMERPMDKQPSGIPVINIYPTYKRNNLIGLTFGNTLGNFGIRGEVGYTPDKPFTTLSIQDEDGIYVADQITSGIAIDYFGISQAIVTVQWFSDALLSDDSNLFMEREQMINYMTFMITRPFLNNKVDAKLFAALGLHNGDGLVELKASYLILDNMKFVITSDVFFGNDNSIIGQFNNADRLMLGLEFGLQSK